MTLHETVENVKKAGIGSIIGIIGIVVIVIIFRIGVAVYNYLYPPQIAPPTKAFGLLPPLEFPNNVTDTNFTYTIQTTTGELPADLPDRLSIFPIVKPAPNFLNLDKVRKKVAALDFVDADGTAIPEKQLADPFYEWDESKDFSRQIIFDINSYNFKMTSQFLQRLVVLSAQHLSDEVSAIDTVKKFLTTAALMPGDLDFTKSSTKNNPDSLFTFPQLFSIQTTPEGNILVPTTSLSKAHVIRVDLYQKDLEYDLKTGEAEEYKPTIKIKLPIVYPNPPYSTMSFWVASGQQEAQVVQSFFTHQKPDLKDASATYKLKTVRSAYDELIGGNAYIASYSGGDNNILIKNVRLAYYLGENEQGYLMPVYVFEGNSGFFAFVSALTDDQLQK